MRYKDFPHKEAYIEWAKDCLRTHSLSDNALGAIWTYYSGLPGFALCGIGPADLPFAPSPHPLNDPLSEWIEFPSAQAALETFEIFPHLPLRMTENEYYTTQAWEVEEMSFLYWRANSVILPAGKTVVIYLPD